MSEAPAAVPATTEAAPATTSTSPPKPKPKPSTTQPKSSTTSPKTSQATSSGDDQPATETAAATDPAEDAYSEGFRLWEAGNYDEAIKSLKAFVAAYPKHRRTSFANNLIGRALLDKGQPNEAAKVLLANYRNNPAGERAPDSLYYLGQAAMKLGQQAQACNVYGELDAVYGAKIRPDLKKLEDDAKAAANCK